MKSSIFALLSALLLLAVGAAAGCATGPDPENRAERPWNSPQDWENGLPPSMMQGR